MRLEKVRMVQFTKMQGIGNDFVIVDAIQEPDLPSDLTSFARTTCDRRFGVGGDGLILLERGETAPFRMRMFNPDGSESEMCGNGIRCFAMLLQSHGHLTEDRVDVETGAGKLTLNLVGANRVRVDMGIARLKRAEIGMTEGPEGPVALTLLRQSFGGQATVPFSHCEPNGRGEGFAVSMGNPHLVIFVDDVAKIDLNEIGPKLEHHPEFPKRVNVHFVQVVDRAHLIQRTWERGAGITLACGTGACACGVAASVTGRSDRCVEIQLPGGKLEIEYAEDGRVFMTGPAETVFTGEIAL